MFKKGESGNPSGRPKGIKAARRNDEFWSTIERLVSRGYDPIDSMIDLAMNLRADPKLRFLADKELMARIAPPIKAITIDATVKDMSFAEELKKQLSEAMIKFKEEY